MDGGACCQARRWVTNQDCVHGEAKPVLKTVDAGVCWSSRGQAYEFGSVCPFDFCIPETDRKKGAFSDPSVTKV